MKIETLKQRMVDSISNVMETMFFCVVDVVTEKTSLPDWFEGKGPLLGAELHFEGPLNGCFYVIAPQKLINEITADFLGLTPEEVQDQERQDTLKEALNMISGSTFTAFDKSRRFQIGIPGLLPTERLAPDQLNGFEDALNVLLDDRPIAIGLTVEDQTS